MISWNGTSPPWFQPPENKRNTWYEDRAQDNTRYGRRSGPYSDPDPEWFDKYSGDNYFGSDKPTGFPAGDTVKFKEIVVDVCHGDSTIYESGTLFENF
jgi:hypothetical protein